VTAVFALERKGAGRPVVFVHGFCQSSAYWAPSLDRIAEHGVHARLLLVATGGFTANEALALEKADALSAVQWTEETVTPIVDGFFHQRPSTALLAEYRKIALSASQRAAVEAARSNATNRTFDQLASIRVPTMIIQGRHDRARTPEHGADMRDRIAGSVLSVIEDAGHTPQLEQAQRFHDVALPFLLSP
jgi:pimeloyl-ACP methyl ester carboxylesterase